MPREKEKQEGLKGLLSIDSPLVYNLAKCQFLTLSINDCVLKQSDLD